MPRYFFDLYNELTVQDDEGQEFADLESAKANALKQVRRLIGGLVVENGRIDLRHHLKVRDRRGAIVHCVEFEDAVSVARWPAGVIDRPSTDVGTPSRQNRPEW